MGERRGRERMRGLQVLLHFISRRNWLRTGGGRGGCQCGSSLNIVVVSGTKNDDPVVTSARGEGRGGLRVQHLPGTT